MMIVKLQQHFPLRVTDWLLGSILLSWGISCSYMDPATWALPAFAGLRAFAHQQTWATLAVVIGFARMIALFVNGAVRRTPHIRGGAAFLSVFIWLQLALSMITAETATTGLGVYPWLFLADIYNVYRAMQDARDSDMRFAARMRTVEDAQHA